jgi:hypothetical protein
MTLTDEPDIIALLDTKLRACASYPGGSDTWFPEAPENTTGTWFVLVDADDQMDAYAQGCAPIGSGQLAVMIFSTTLSVGDLKQLALDLMAEALTAPGGIKLRSGGAPIANKAGKAKRVSGHTVNNVQITFQYGLSA